MTGYSSSVSRSAYDTTISRKDWNELDRSGAAILGIKQNYLCVQPDKGGELWINARELYSLLARHFAELDYYPQADG